jgi:hypothetical protein
LTPPTILPFIARFYLECLFRRVIQAVKRKQGAIYDAVQSNEAVEIVQKFQSKAVRAKYPKMSAVDRLLAMPAVKDAVWEVSCIAHRCVPPLSDCSRLQELKIPSDVKYPSRFPDVLTYGVLSDEVYTLAGNTVYVVSDMEPEFKNFYAAVAAIEKGRVREFCKYAATVGKYLVVDR